MDHSLANGPTPESTTISTRAFADDMHLLVAAGYRTVTPEQVAAWHAGHGSLPPNALLLTFDGGRTDTVLNAAPILHRLGLLATVFMIGGAYRQAPVFYASPDQLRSLEREGWSIEAHAIAGHGSVGACRPRPAAPVPRGAACDERLARAAAGVRDSRRP